MIKLRDILLIKDPENYKMHCAVWNQIKQPLDVFSNDREEWHGWNRYKTARNEFNRDYIFSLMRFYHEENVWLFGGIYKVLSNEGEEYKIALQDIGQEFIGRLKLGFKLTGRNMRPRLESHYDQILVTEILKEPYSGSAFGGYENINLSFEQLEFIIKNQKPDWKAALQNVKGVYLITDKNKGKRYVGSAYGDTGIWSRWACYVETGHGWNEGLNALLKQEGVAYARQHFQFTLLEFRSMRADDAVIIERECFWKEALLSRGDYGYNQN